MSNFRTQLRTARLEDAATTPLLQVAYTCQLNISNQQLALCLFLGFLVPSGILRSPVLYAASIYTPGHALAHWSGSSTPKRSGQQNQNIIFCGEWSDRRLCPVHSWNLQNLRRAHSGSFSCLEPKFCFVPSFTFFGHGNTQLSRQETPNSVREWEDNV